jgi:hypothetical protein
MVVTGESQVELFSDDEEEEVVVAVGGRCSHTLVTGDALVFICRLAPSPFFDQQQAGPGRYDWEKSSSPEADARAADSARKTVFCPRELRRNGRRGLEDAKRLVCR